MKWIIKPTVERHATKFIDMYLSRYLPAGCTASIYLFKVNNRNTRKRSEIFSMLTVKSPERC